MAKNELHTILIEKLVASGYGLGRLDDGIVVLVRYALPGEKVVVRELERKKDYLTAALQEVLSASPDRVKPPCPVFAGCGGCDLQHAAPGAQRRLKQAILADSLLRAGGDIFSSAPPRPEPTLAAPTQFGYRQRLRLQVDATGNFGFYRPESHVIEPVARCLLAGEGLNNVLQQLGGAASFRELVGRCPAFELLLNPATGSIILLLHFQRKPRKTDCLLAADLADGIDGLAAVFMQVEGHGLYDPLARIFPAKLPVLSTTAVLGADREKFNFSWEVGAFCQVNLEQNNNLVQLVLEMVAAGPHGTILDLFCGHGNFSLPAARLADEVLGIDAQNASIRSARRNSVCNEVHNCRFEKIQVQGAVNALIAAGKTFATVILDPPRRGAPETVALLPKLGPERIIYVSCNPATLARDLAALIPAGYQLSRLAPVDMFPQTHHLETVALLEKRPGRGGNQCLI